MRMNDDEYRIIDEGERSLDMQDSQIGIAVADGRIGVAIRAVVTMPDGEEAEITVNALMEPRNATIFAQKLMDMASGMDDGEDGERCRTSPPECRPDGPEGSS